MSHPPMSLLHSQINQGKFPFPPFSLPLNLHTRSPSPNQNINNSNFNGRNNDRKFDRKRENNNEENEEPPIIKKEISENDHGDSDSSDTELDLSVSGRKRNGGNCD